MTVTEFGIVILVSAVQARKVDVGNEVIALGNVTLDKLMQS